MQDGDDLGIGLDSSPNDPSTDENDLADLFWMLFPVVFFGLLVALFVVF